MSYSASDTVERLTQLLVAQGYQVHEGRPEDETTGWWFTWMPTGMAECKVGETENSEEQAWAGAMEHFFEHARVPLHVS